MNFTAPAFVLLFPIVLALHWMLPPSRRWVLLLAASLVLASFATSLVAFQFVFGFLVGVAGAAVFAPMMACVTGWFDTHRSLAVSLVSAGMGMAPMTMSPFAAWLVSGHDWRTSMQIIALVVAVVMIPVSLLIRRPPALEAGNEALAAANGAIRVRKTDVAEPDQVEVALREVEQSFDRLPLSSYPSP